MKIILNYIGQLRLYSLVDLVLLLYVLKVAPYQFIGIIFLHVAFLAYLEDKHAHSYRLKIPSIIYYLFGITGLVFFGKIEGLLYVICSYFYTLKTKNLGLLSPFLRGSQNFFITAAILGYSSSTPYLVGLVFFVRNLAGDFRDIEKDKKENIRTIPIILEIKKNFNYIHLITITLSSIVWWSLSAISVSWLILVILIEISSYNLTPR